MEMMQVDADNDHDVADNDNVIVDSSSMDIEAYAAQYSGLAKFYRLLFVAKHCPGLRLEALRLALTSIKQTYATSMYQLAHAKLAEHFAQTQPDEVVEPPFDRDWMELTSKQASYKLEKLDSDLKNFKNNSIKESIRRGNDDLGYHYLDMGDLGNALKCYSRMRDYCTSSKHVINMSLNVIKVSILLQNWSHVLSYVNKAVTTPDYPEKDFKNAQTVDSRLKCSGGLAELAQKRYRQAARSFLKASFDHCDFPDFLSPFDIAVYGSLCALATFDREEIHNDIIQNNSFKQFLEVDHQLRDAVFSFYDSKYDQCLRLLDVMRDNLILDMYLSPHVHALYAQIRSRALCQTRCVVGELTGALRRCDSLLLVWCKWSLTPQYFSPYKSASMLKMSRAFNTTVAKLEEELMQLILNDHIKARIDSHNKILYAKDIEERQATFERSLQICREYQHRTRSLITRAALVKHNIVVKPATPEDSRSKLNISPAR